MANKFDLASVLKNVPNLDTGREQMEYIDISLLDSDEKNFYHVDGVADLASNIELVGLQQPLRIRPNIKTPGRYIIVSGHRRHAALQLLVKDGKERFKTVPCIVGRGEESEAMRELRLIYANSDTRRMSSADISKQAERVEMLLYQLKEEGVEFPGRMRDHVAQACQVSKSKLARLKVIRDHLIPELREKWENNKLYESVAYAIAQRTPSEQRLLLTYKMSRGGIFSEWEVKTFLDNAKARMTCQCEVTGESCDNYQQLFDNYASGTRGCAYCMTNCCMDCFFLRTCEMSICPRAQDERERQIKAHAEQEAERKAQSDLEREKYELEKAARELRDRQTWMRAGQAAEKAGVSIKEFIELIGDDPDDEEVWEEVAARLDGSAEIFDWHKCGDVFDEYDDIGDLVHVADALECSIDWLLGRDGYVSESPGFKTGTPPKAGLYWARFDIEGTKLEQAALWVPHLSKWTFKSGAGIDAKCECWYPLPEGT